MYLVGSLSSKCSLLLSMYVRAISRQRGDVTAIHAVPKNNRLKFHMDEIDAAITKESQLFTAYINVHLFIHEFNSTALMNASYESRTGLMTGQLHAT